MLISLGFTIAGLIFLSVIAVISFTKKKYNNIENYIYRFLLIITLFLLLLEVICVFSMANRDKIPLLNEILCRLYILGDIVWFIAIAGYTKCLGDNKQYKSPLEFFGQNFMMSFIFIGILSFFISCLLPMTYGPSSGKIFVIGGQAVFSLYVVFAFIGLYMLYVLLKNKNNSSLMKRMPLVVFLVTYFIAGCMQLYFKTDLNDLTFMFAIYVICMYFTVENQDLKLLQELEIAKKEAEEADKEKTEFLSNMSHEIRTPMNTIMGFSETLMNKEIITKEDIKKDVNNIHISAVNLLEIINNILDISRIESGKEEVIETEYSIKDIVYELSSFYDSKIDKKNINFNINVADNIPSLLKGDKVKVYKVISNIISNATKYTHSGEILLDIKCNTNDDLASLIINVKDTGIGIKKEDFSKLFQKFSKLEINQQHDAEGTGLGLIITKKLVDLLEGEITFESEYGVGSTFTVNINQKIVDYNPIGKIVIKESKEKEKYLDCSKYKILIVDDNPLNIKVASKLLEKYKFKITSVNSGKECIEITKKDKFDLIFLDHMMPGLDGIETIKILKKLKIKSKIIAMTANAVTENETMYLNEGFDAYISKPINIKNLNKLIKTIYKK